jgi:beta-glucosidase
MGFHALRDDAVTKTELDNQSRVRALAGECVVILENDGALPLKTTGKIALFGNGARHMIKGGTGSGDVNSRYVINIEDGLKDAGFEITTASWLDRFDQAFTKNQEDYVAMVKRVAEEKKMSQIEVMFADPISIPKIPEVTSEDISASDTDTAVYVVSRDSGEGGDRKCKEGDYLFREDELNAMKVIASSYKNFIVLLNVGGIVDIKTVKSIEGVNAIAYISQLGNIGGYVVADVLTGKADPSGRLTDTWAKNYEDYPGYKDFSSNNVNTDDEFYKEGIFIGYRYFDTFDIEPLYPFGYGLGYTTFDISVQEVNLEGSFVSISADVLNTGAHKGKETVQVYVSAPNGIADKPYQELAAYEKTPELAPGESCTVEISFDIRDIASYEPKSASRILDKGDYYIRVGKNSRSTKIAAVINIGETIVTEQLKNLFEADIPFEELTNPNKTRQIASFNPDDEAQADAVTSFELDPDSIRTVKVSYTGERAEITDKDPSRVIRFEDVVAGKASVEDLTAQLTVPEMAKLCVGSYSSFLEASVVGAASESVPGAAAETPNDLLESRGIPVMILADGPAGLRLQPHFKATPDGKLLPGGEVFGLSYRDFPEDTPADAVDYYQYCTAVPIATALAQTWNKDLIREVGTIVGEEMKIFGVHFWLAPGMNIHRNPLCGRNFEYYSEDPLISGLCAAYDTMGVQSFPGQGTTIKHYAGNNQEDNRMHSNSHMSEKALRDLYLKGFGIAIKLSQPYSIMTSYNLINGIHAANSHDLIQAVARDEFGFKGVVMTDWYTSQEFTFGGVKTHKYPCSSSPLCIRAGNDWQMPGCEKNVTDIIDAVNDGSLPKADLQFCTCNILRMAVKCFS